jgi:mono/diheme cytochrome c family protein
MKKKLRLIVPAVILLGLAGWAAFSYWRTKNVSRVQRGWRVAERKGCFTCHGPGGLRGMANPGYGFDEVPPFSGGLITMYVESEAEIREWILDGLPQRIARDPEQRKHRDRAVIQMPAWRGLLSQGELEELVAFVKAASDFEKPQDEKADEGRKVADKFGCFNCHGPQGRGSAPNLRAFKGYIPAWDGADFPELAADDGEVREWILDGRPKRLHENAVARWFLSRQPIKMPAYRGHIGDAEVDRIVDYIHWVRQHPY